MDVPPPPYLTPTENQGNIRPPPYRRNIPRYDPGPQRKKRGFLFKCICCCYCFLLILIIILAGLAFYFYKVYKPEIPKYSVQGVSVKAFKVQKDFSLSSEFQVTVKAKNPNKGIGFNYGAKNSVKIYYKDTTICSGKVPAFHQDHESTKEIKIDMKGKTQFGSQLTDALKDNQKKHRVPLLVAVKMPVQAVVGKLEVRELTVFVNISLTLDSLTPQKAPKVIKSEYKYAWEF